jgi:hypothetical protein
LTARIPNTPFACLSAQLVAACVYASAINDYVTGGYYTVSLPTTEVPVPTPAGPCVVVDTNSLSFGIVTIGTTSAPQNVTVTSCSDAPITLNAAVSAATSGAQTLAPTPTAPAAGQFQWSLQPAGAPSPVVLQSTPTATGTLAPSVSRVDAQRITLPNDRSTVGSVFAATVTYTATT